MDTEKTRDQLRETIRKNLISLRKSKGVSQADIAMLVGKKSTSVASWEQGLSLPDVTTLFKLAHYYNCPMEYFYEEHDNE